MRPLAGLLMLAAGLAAGGTALAQSPKAPPVSGVPLRPAAPAPVVHGASELDCLACHRDKHRAVLGLAAGTGGRGVPASPDRMFGVRVQCAACHTKPTATPGSAGLGGQTFEPAEQACVTCHGERYRPMLARWREGFGRMRETLAPKLANARAALAAAAGGQAAHPKISALLDDAEFNLSYVALGNGAHNVFYSANLLRRANASLEEATGALGRARPRTDDALVRGGYCATLCHEPAGRALRESVVFRGRALPHARHVAELGATCTSCHSADVHKKLSATPATCSGCHHAPANEQCETCHRAQTAFYRGTVTSPAAPIAPNRMAGAVTCTGCHDFTRRHSRAAVGDTCLGCHDASYLPLFTEWTSGFGRDLAATTAAVRAAEHALAQARRSGRPIAAAEALVTQARDAAALVRAGGVAHNPLAADALLAAARARSAEASARLHR